MNALLAKNYLNTQVGGIARNRFVVFGATDDAVQLATGVASLIVGVTQELATVQNERVDVTHVGAEYVEAGAVFARGARLTSDATGRAVLAAATNNQGAVALESATAVGQLVRCLVLPGVV